MLIKNANVVLRIIHGSVFLIDISDNYAGDKCALYEINATGKFLWEILDKNGSLDALTDALRKAIIDEVPYEELYSDVSEYIEELKNQRFVLVVDSNG